MYGSLYSQHISKAMNTSSDSDRSIQSSLTFWVQWVVGMGLAMSLLFFLTSAVYGEAGFLYRLLGLLTLLGSVPIYATLRVYQRTHGFTSGIARLLAGWCCLMGAAFFMALITHTAAMYDQQLLMYWAFIGFFPQAVSFVILHWVAQIIYQRGRTNRTALIIGTDDDAYQFADILVKQRGEPLKGMVIASDSWEEQKKGRYPILGSVSGLRDIIKKSEIKRVYIYLPFESIDQVEGLYIDLMDANVDVVWVPDFRKLILLNHSIREIGGLAAIHLNESPLTADPTGAFLKSVMDKTLALMGLIILSPILIVTAIAVKFSSPGPIIFKQPRHGWNGEIIKVWKFRSMRVHADKTVKQAQKDDPRVTKIGRFIRRTSIDELPQLFNVLFGEMSLVGPRPHAVAHNDYYSNKINAYMSRHRIKPGITGLAQISGARGETETIEKMQRRVELDLDYINNWSVWLDIKILIKTPFTLFSKNIY